MNNLNDMIDIYLLQKDIPSVYTHNSNLFNSKLKEQLNMINNSQLDNIDKIVDSIIDTEYSIKPNKMNYSNLENTLQRIDEIDCKKEEDSDKCIENAAHEKLTHDYKVQKPPDCDEKIKKLLLGINKLQAIIKHQSNYIYKYDMILNNLDINKGGKKSKTLSNSLEYNRKVLGEMSKGSYESDSKLEIINTDGCFNNDKKLLEALITIQENIISNNIGKMLIRIKLFIGDSVDKSKLIKEFEELKKFDPKQ
jgi:hypothetical protein